MGGGEDAPGMGRGLGGPPGPPGMQGAPPLPPGPPPKVKESEKERYVQWERPVSYNFGVSSETLRWQGICWHCP